MVEARFHKGKENLLNPFTTKSAKFKTEGEFLNFKQHHFEVLLNSFHLNGHILGFRPQTQQLKPHLLTEGLILRVKGLKVKSTIKQSEHKCFLIPCKGTI